MARRFAAPPIGGLLVSGVVGVYGACNTVKLYNIGLNIGIATRHQPFYIHGFSSSSEICTDVLFYYFQTSAARLQHVSSAIISATVDLIGRHICFIEISSRHPSGNMTDVLFSEINRSNLSV